MKVKELAEKLNKSPEEIKKVLAELGVTVKAVTSTVEKHIADKVIQKLTPPKTTKVLRVIKKADLANVNVPVVEGADQTTPVTAGQKAIQVIAQEKQKKADELHNEADKKENKTESTAHKDAHPATTSSDGTTMRSAESSLNTQKAPAPATDATPAVAAAAGDATKKPEEQPSDWKDKLKKEKEKSFRHEKTFFQEKDVTAVKVFNQKPKKSKSKYKKMRLREEEAQSEPEDTTPPTDVILTEETSTVHELAKKFKKSPMDIIGLLLKEKILLTINQPIDLGLASRIGELLGITVTADFSEKESSKIKYDLNLMENSEIEDTTESLITRPPIVTIMGHVDHGKTKLLDTIRSSRIVEGEAGGITQHIGAYQVEFNGKKISFLDTPGHEAFTALRARGAQVTDVVILVVAANDGIMPQTLEALDHAKAAGVPIIVAINKIDLPEANIENVKQQLTQHSLVPEEWGGTTVICPISAKQNIGIDNLLDMVLLTAEVEDLKANPNKRAQGIIIESRLTKDRGPVATVLIKAGTLRKGDPYVIGATYGRVRAMFNDLGKEVLEAPPSFPVEIIGITEVPNAGEIFQVVESDKEARQISEKRASEVKDLLLAKKQKLTLAAISKGINNKEKKNLNIVLKADVQGSLEALTSSIAKIQNDHVTVNVIHSGTGIITESDVMLAKASEAVILSFHVSTQGEAEILASREGIEIRAYDIIYKLLEDLELAISGMLEPEYEDYETGKAIVRSVFQSSKMGAIAGSQVTEGVIKRVAAKVQVWRGNKMIHEGKLAQLKRFKDDVKEVTNGMECGITLEKFSTYAENDILVFIETREKPRDRKK